MFDTKYNQIIEQIAHIDPVAYGRTRNYIDGDVTRLSPYISRGVISTRYLLRRVLDAGFEPRKIEKFIQELAWRDYWQQIWVAKGELINSDLKKLQDDVNNQEMPQAIAEAVTGIEAIDNAVRDFYQNGYLHNHIRMYIASIACNIGKSHWNVPARWMYYHLLDGDWASNALSWQWVAGSNSGKKYFANQENINKYCYSNQRGTFLDADYNKIAEMETPEVLRSTFMPVLNTPLPKTQTPEIETGKPILIYNYYNLDPEWKKDIPANRILLLEPSHFRDYPVSGKNIEFMIALSRNIPGLRVFTGEFNELMRESGREGKSASAPTDGIYYKEHPRNKHYCGIEESRDWMFDVKGYYPSFFAFWKKCRKELTI